ncbi:glycosyltransferase family 4 protein, partial [Palleronia sp.]|uniref:glycosyltransferase family 4 protein n=1 Tax=Palleronia sp. TaxID=1940284 RepID=UPI0035C7D622
IGLAKPSDEAFVADLHRRIDAKGLGDRFHFTGVLPLDRLRSEILPALSLVVNVARYEPFGVVPIEGMAAGTPFVCSDTGHYRAFSDGGRTGLIVQTEDADATAAAVGGLLSNPDRIEHMGRAARKKAVADHSIAREADGAAEVYERLWAGEDLAVHRPPL